MIRLFKKTAKATILKLIIGGYFTVSGLIDKQWQIAVLGALMIIFSLTVKIPCSTGTCTVRKDKNQ
ncbi:hypothetical protein [Chitinophaga sp.]|uniref:hypothetical protein n=1 Tax=Chitinophaga sp. TaxID=1869181 RepID=UPI0031E08D97